MKGCSGVFEGGGVRGIAHVGAACAVEAAGYRFESLAGSSAGAIVAALLAAGYSCGQMKREMMNLDYRRFRGRSWEDYFGTVGKMLSLFFTLGIYHIDYLEQWMEEMLEPKGIRTFGDVEKRGRRLFVTASDITDRRLLVFPRDGAVFGLRPQEVPVALAVKASASIPVYFEPVRLQDVSGHTHLLADGGLLSNYPAWTLDPFREGPVFGFRFRTKKEEENGGYLKTPVSLAEYLKAVVGTCMDAIDHNCQSLGPKVTPVWISPEVGEGKERRNVGSTEFGLSRAWQEELFENGKRAGREALGQMGAWAG